MPESKPRLISTHVFFRRILFDHAQAFLEHQLLNPQASQWESAVIQPLRVYLKLAKDAEKTKSMLDRWLNLSTPIGQVDLKNFNADPRRLQDILESLHPVERAKLMARASEARLRFEHPNAVECLEPVLKSF